MQNRVDWTAAGWSWATAPLRLALECRVGIEWGAMVAAQPVLRRMPQGDGHAVLVLPYLFGSDLTTQPLRTSLACLGYQAVPAGLGLNLGPRQGLMDAALKRLLDLRRRSGRPVSLIGWSIGGLYARALAKEAPDAVRLVITLGTPLNGQPSPAEMWRLAEQVTGQPFGLSAAHGPLDEPPPVPTTAIFSRSDGIVPWRDSLQREGPLSENIEVESSHFGLGLNPLVGYVIADRLAQPEGAWQPFRREGLRALIYPDQSR